MQRTLFGCAIPEGAVRVVIRPILGRGGAIPLYEGRLEVDAVPTDTDVQIAASRNAGFWDYIHAQVKNDRIPAADTWEWKLRLSFFDQNNVEEARLTESAFEFFRSASAGKLEASSAEAQLAALLERGLAVIQTVAEANNKALHKTAEACADAIGKVVASSTAAIAEASKAGAAAVAEATKQTAIVSELTKALLNECGELKEGIFELQTERAKTPAQPPKGVADQVKEVVEMGKALVSLGDRFMGSGPETPTPPAPPPAAGKAGA